MAIEVVNRQRLAPVERRRVAELAQATLDALHKMGKLANDDACLTIAFVRDQAIRRLNRDYRGRDYATDVLSFPARDEADEGQSAPGRAEETGEASEDVAAANYLGDIVIATDTATRQAQDAGLTLAREIEELVIHGVLHLCGYDHETDGGEMNRLEVRLRRRLLGQD